MSARNPATRISLGVALVTGAALLASACGSSGSSGAAATTARATARSAAVIKGLDNPFFQAMEQGMNDQASGRRAGHRPGRQTSPTPLRAGRQAARPGRAGLQLLRRQPDLRHNLIQGMAQLAAKKAIVNIDSPIDADGRQGRQRQATTYIGTDNVRPASWPARRWRAPARRRRRSRSSAASPATSPAAPGSTGSPRAWPATEAHPRRSPPTGTARWR